MSLKYYVFFKWNQKWNTNSVAVNVCFRCIFLTIENFRSHPSSCPIQNKLLFIYNHPIIAVISWLGSTTREVPKSINFMWFPLTRIFELLTRWIHYRNYLIKFNNHQGNIKSILLHYLLISLWIIPWEWRNSRALAICRAKEYLKGQSISFVESRRTCDKLPSLTNSATKDKRLQVANFSYRSLYNTCSSF